MTVKTALVGFVNRVSKAYTPNELQKHISQTYRSMRILAAALAFALPIVLWLVGGYWFNIELQESMSAYYHTPMRNFFVGSLFIVGALLFVYRGFSTSENQFLNAAGVLAVLVALFPTSSECALQCLDCKGASITPYTNGKVHGFCAVLFFICIAWVCIVESRHTLTFHNRHTKAFERAYRTLGVLMIVLPVSAWIVSLVIDALSPNDRGIWLFWVEFAAVWVFGAYWAVKTLEIEKNDIDLKVMRAAGFSVP